MATIASSMLLGFANLIFEVRNHFGNKGQLDIFWVNELVLLFQSNNTGDQESENVATSSAQNGALISIALWTISYGPKKYSIKSIDVG